MTRNKQVVETYMEGFRRSDHALILSCLTDDIEWSLPGAFEARGKQEFDEHIESDSFVGSPEIVVTRLTEEADVVVAEGFVRTQHRDGTIINLAMCDVCEMRDGKIRRLTSYLMNVA